MLKLLVLILISCVIQAIGTPAIANDSICRDDLFNMYDLSDSVFVAELVNLNPKSNALIHVRKIVKGLSHGSRFIRVNWLSKKYDSPKPFSSWILFIPLEDPGAKKYSTYSNGKGIVPFTQEILDALLKYRMKGSKEKSTIPKRFAITRNEHYNSSANELKEFLKGQTDVYHGYDARPVIIRRTRIINDRE